MSKTKQDHLNALVAIAFRLDDKANLQYERSAKVQRMAALAKQGLKDSEEFKRLDSEYRKPTVIDFGNEIGELQRVVKQLRKYKFK